MTRFTVLLICALAVPAAALGPDDFAWRWSLKAMPITQSTGSH